jgi:hypothetical protein
VDGWNRRPLAVDEGSGQGWVSYVGQGQCPGQPKEKWASTLRSEKPARPSWRLLRPSNLASVRDARGHRIWPQDTAPVPGSPSAGGSSRRAGLAPRQARTSLVSRCGAALAAPGAEQPRGAGRGRRAWGGGSPDPAGGERADRIWSLREAWSEVAPCAAGPCGGARLCGGLEATAPPQYLRVCRWVSVCICACRRSRL